MEKCLINTKKGTRCTRKGTYDGYCLQHKERLRCPEIVCTPEIGNIPIDIQQIVVTRSIDLVINWSVCCKHNYNACLQYSFFALQNTYV